MLFDRMNELGLTKRQLENEVEHLESILESLKSPIVFCHNDLIPKNLIYDEQERKLHDQAICLLVGNHQLKLCNAS